MNILSDIHPSMFDSPDGEVTYVWQARPQVYLCAHKGREKEYGIPEFVHVAKEFPELDFHIYGKICVEYGGKNIYVHGDVSNSQFNEEIKKYHCFVRLNSFDGFAEGLAKSVLLEQYQISRIRYPGMSFAPTIKELRNGLRRLRNKKEPNPMSGWWKRRLQISLNEMMR